MGDATGIQWTDATWNPVTGCSKVSPGCAHCYAEVVAKRFWPLQYLGHPSLRRQVGPRRFDQVWTHEDRLDQPLRWKKPRRIFVNSMSDLFHEDVPDAFIDRVFAVMALAPQHTFQILTKRAERMRDYMTKENYSRLAHVAKAAHVMVGGNRVGLWPLPNVWLGVSVENQRLADERIPLLLQTPAAVRFISAEPLLGAVDVEPFLQYEPFHEHYKMTLGASEWRGLDWVIVGGESGAEARPFAEEWARSIVNQCRAASVPVFVKQLGSNPHSLYVTNNEGVYIGGVGGRLRDSHGGDPSEWPMDLRVREFPLEAR